MSFFNELRRRNVLRVAAAYIVTSWLIIQVVETILPAFGIGDNVLRTVVIVLGIGLIPALVLAWVFELTPDGLKKEKDIERLHSITPQTGKKLDRVIMVVLALALGYFAFDKFVLSQSRESAIAQTARLEGRSEALTESYGDHSIAVLPFVDMSPEGDQEYFSDGIAEELLNLLAKIPELRVISRSSAFAYKGRDINLTEVARELNVAHILEGSVRKAGNQVRITAQLIEARSDTHLWSETYDRPLDNIFAVQDEISSQVVEQLRIKLLGAVPKALETDPAAFAVFLRARYLRRQNSSDSLEQAINLFQQVLETDPDYMPALDDLISSIMNQSYSPGYSFETNYERARELALAGLEGHPDFARLYIQLGWIQMYKDGDLQAAAKSYQRGLELEPTNLTSLGDTATFLYMLGRLDEAIALGHYTNIRDPVHPVGFANQGLFLLSAGRFSDAVKLFRRVLQLSPDYSQIHYYLGLALSASGDAAAAMIEMRQEPDEPYRLEGLASVYHDLVDAAESKQALDALLAGNNDAWNIHIARVYAHAGDADEALKWLDSLADNSSSALAEIHLDPQFVPIHNDPRWIALLEKLGKSPAQLAAMEFEITLPEDTTSKHQ